MISGSSPFVFMRRAFVRTNKIHEITDVKKGPPIDQQSQDTEVDGDWAIVKSWTILNFLGCDRSFTSRQFYFTALALISAECVRNRLIDPLLHRQ
jgi:hypothetical protein